MSIVIALNDGDTYTAARGCRIVSMPDNLYDEEEYLQQGDGTLYEFDGTEIVALNDDERDAILEALHYLEEQGDGKYKDSAGRTVRKSKRERVLTNLYAKLEHEHR